MDPTLYLFDGSNLFHAGGFRDRDELVDLLASYVAVRGAQGVVVFDGAGPERTLGPLTISYAPHADSVLERLAAERREHESVLLVTSDTAIRGTSGQEVRHRASGSFLDEVARVTYREDSASRLGDRIDDATRERLERLRRGLEP